ncbi:MAG: response regulator transcription factor [Flavitalea sp.]
MKIPINIIIADDHEVYRDGLKTLLESYSHIHVINEAANGQQVIQICDTVIPDIILMDIMMPVMDGIAATAYIHTYFPSVRVIALSMFNQDNMIIDMLEAGATGYLIKNANKQEIVEAIDSVNRNLPYYCKSTTIKLARLIGSSNFGSKALKKIVFTEKELTIIRMICEDKTNNEIGEMLFMSGRTVEEYRKKIKEKMDAKGTAGIVIYAIKNLLFDPRQAKPNF